jgi:peptidoglycan-N-acetylglucosamine deacetylase
MKLYWIKTHKFVKKIFFNYVWDIPTRGKVVYLTFDDGPTPKITDWVLHQLKINGAKATFFCIGKNIENNPEILNRIIEEGHSVGNHTFNHLNGWKTKTNFYIDNIKQKAEIYKLQSKLFRPPYGRIKSNQAKFLLESGYKIIMWDVLSADFDKDISPEKCLENVTANLKSGSIIVFHDSEKAFKNLEYVLPKTLRFLEENGYISRVIL